MTIELEPQKSNGLKNFRKMLLNHWKLFLFSMVVFIALGKAYLMVATPQYLISSALVVEAQAAQASPSSAFAGGLSTITPAENLKNEGDVLRTRNLIQETVKTLHLNVNIFSGSGLLAQQIYDESPFEASISNQKVDTLKRKIYKIEVINRESFHLSNDDDDLEVNGQFGKAVKLPQYDLVIQPKPHAPIVQSVYSVQITSEDEAIATLLKNYDAEFSDKTTSAVDITLYYPNAKRGELIVDHLMRQYLKDNISTKKAKIDSMLTFINNRIALVEKELSGIEGNYEQYKADNSIADINEQSRVLVGNANDYQNQYNNQQVQLTVIYQLEKFLKDPSNKQIIPGALNIQDGSFTAALNDYNGLIIQRQKKLLSYTEESPLVVNIDEQLAISRENLLQNIKSYKQAMEAKSAKLGDQSSLAKGTLKSVPTKQRSLNDYGRQQELKQQLYIYLLQKREETALAKTSNIPTSHIIDNAKSTKDPAKPLKPVIYLLSALLGFIVPFGYVNNKTQPHVIISSEQDIQDHTDVSIIGKIGHSTLSNRVMIEDSAKSAVTESFRTLRTKIQNILNSDETQIIMVTSSVNGEGKTFISANLANILAKTDKKVLLMELDLRKPKLSEILNQDSSIAGFSDYMQGTLELDDIIKRTELNENLFLISSGPVVSNASELLLNKKTKFMLDTLKEQFDYIIIDSSPMGLVSDALILEKFADMTIYICRHNYTNTEQINLVNQLKSKDNIENMYLVINDVDFAKAGYFGYGYGLGYGNES
ncbi:exopolysaccharide transport family protein [Mucilaginibacter aquaedulcis]|uniref:exopolysaccharide transport family protein n=1 Tax=Mucilaginibacter aquaedulcis TaxID=1187081 RepID=UPI0025B3F073|nr:tyrosine-protein kinase family protein [Mucilaginibacter aquaedulcis]MDN3550484.1 polysaccharide biosynthesis tyrosine autokinase [Mucilaginibacter aquaedulcis]